MKVFDVYEYYNYNWAEATRRLGLGANTYQYWRKVGYIPIRMQLKIEKKTKGMLKADIDKNNY